MRNRFLFLLSSLRPRLFLRESFSSPSCVANLSLCQVVANSERYNSFPNVDRISRIQQAQRCQATPARIALIISKDSSSSSSTTNSRNTSNSRITTATLLRPTFLSIRSTMDRPRPCVSHFSNPMVIRRRIDIPLSDYGQQQSSFQGPPASYGGQNQHVNMQPPNQQQYSSGGGKRKALCVGINYVGTSAALAGCHNDARNLSKFLCGQFAPTHCP